jgi:hypothetical protein
MATGDLVCFLGNDDILLPNHFAERVKSMHENPHADVCFHDAAIALQGTRVAIRGGGELAHGTVGGSELVIRKKFLDEHGITFRSGEYGHDWTFIEDLQKAGAVFEYYPSVTYLVKHVPGVTPEDDID